MKIQKLILMILFSQIIMIKAPSPVVAQKLDEIVKRFTQSTYGETSVESIRTIRTVGYISTKNGLPISYFVNEKKLPDMEKTEYFKIPYIKEYAIVYGGEISWERKTIKGSLEVVKLSEERSRSGLSRLTIVEPFIQPERIGAKVELAGKKKFGGVDSFELIVTFEDGNTLSYYIDSKEYYLLGTSSILDQSGNIGYFAYHKDYRTVGGIKFPFILEQRGPKGEEFDFRFIRIEINPEILESNFKMP